MKLIFCSLLLFAGVANAKSVSGKVLRVEEGGMKVTISSYDEMRVRKGDIVNLGEACDVEVEHVEMGRVVVDTSLCELRPEFKHGLQVTLVDEVHFGD